MRMFLFPELNYTANGEVIYPKGPDGPVGNQGTKGDKGLIGNSGYTPPGPPGIQGIQGIKGDRGNKGYIGEKGINGPQGKIGNRGPPGDVGDRGQKGDKGDRGNKGYTGYRGEKGARGEKGNKGDKGVPDTSNVSRICIDNICINENELKKILNLKSAKWISAPPPSNLPTIISKIIKEADGNISLFFKTEKELPFLNIGGNRDYTKGFIDVIALHLKNNKWERVEGSGLQNGDDYRGRKMKFWNLNKWDGNSKLKIDATYITTYYNNVPKKYTFTDYYISKPKEQKINSMSFAIDHKDQGWGNRCSYYGLYYNDGSKKHGATYNAAPPNRTRWNNAHRNIITFRDPKPIYKPGIGKISLIAGGHYPGCSVYVRNARGIKLNLSDGSTINVPTLSGKWVTGRGKKNNHGEQASVKI